MFRIIERECRTRFDDGDNEGDDDLSGGGHGDDDRGSDDFLALGLVTVVVQMHRVAVNINSRPSPPLERHKPQTQHPTVEARKLEHGFRRISARIPYTLPQGHEDNDVPTFWLLL